MSNCKQFNCRCTIYVESTSKWSKGKCKTCQHKQQQHGNVFKAIAKKQSNQTDASSVTPNVSNKKNQNLSLSKVTMSAKSINIPIKIEELRDSADKIDESIDIKAMYSSTTTIQDILDKIISHLNTKYSPCLYHIYQVSSILFGQISDDSYLWDQEFQKSLTEYTKHKITECEWDVLVHILYEHKPKNIVITCPHITGNGAKCPIYLSMIKNYNFTENNLSHLLDFEHFKDKYEGKPSCKYGVQCKSFLRLEEGGHNLNDRCHIKLYHHPPRNDRQIKMNKNLNKWKFNTTETQNHPVLKPTYDDLKEYDINEKDGLLPLLIEEVISNGYSVDLALTNDDHKNKKWTILQVVDQKLNSVRHKQMGSPLRRDHMLALLLYTGCECIWDLNNTQRNGDYEKWKWFDYCLYAAISALRDRERGYFKLYSGVKCVQLNQKMVENGYFVQYTSTTWDKNVALQFLGDQKGIILEFDKVFRYDADIFCCDVSWISKFEDECEILFARSSRNSWDHNNFSFEIVDQQKGIQTVSVSYSKHAQ
eukprot:266750_1